VYGYNITVLGSTSASTCDGSSECHALGELDFVGSTCYSVIGDSFRRVGILSHHINSRSKLCEHSTLMEECRPPNLPEKGCLLPWEARASPIKARYSESHWTSITIGHFSASDCGMSSVAYTINPTSIDLNFPSFWSDVKYVNTMPAARFFLDYFGGNSRNRQRYCMEGSDCDGLSQLALVDVDGTLLESSVPGGTVVPLANAALATSACVAQSGYYACDSLKLRLLKWEAVGENTNRNLGNFRASRESDGRAVWSRGYFSEDCQPVEDGIDLDRHWMIRPNDEYNLTLFVTTPKFHSFRWFNDEESDKLLIGLTLTSPASVNVYVDGVLMDESEYDLTQAADGPRYPTLDDLHGSYAFDPSVRTVFFVMRGGSFGDSLASEGGGEVFLRLLEVVQLTMTLSVNTEDFDGPELVNNLALLLGIAASRIKVVAVQSSAQVAGRALDAMSRRLSGSSVVVQIVEEDPEPLPGDAFTGDSDSGSVSTTATDTTTADLNVTNDLFVLADLFVAKLDSGELSTAIGFTVSSVDVDITDLDVETSSPTSSPTSSTTSSTAAAVEAVVSVEMSCVVSSSTDKYILCGNVQVLNLFFADSVSEVSGLDLLASQVSSEVSPCNSSGLSRRLVVELTIVSSLSLFSLSDVTVVTDALGDGDTFADAFSSRVSTDLNVTLTVSSVSVTTDLESDTTSDSKDVFADIVAPILVVSSLFLICICAVVGASVALCTRSVRRTRVQDNTGTLHDV